MLPTINQAQRCRRIALLLGAVGVGSLLAVALPELIAAGEAAVAASPATVKIDNFAFAPGVMPRNCAIARCASVIRPMWAG